MATTYGSAPVAHAVCRLQAVRKLLAGTRLGGKTMVNPDGSDSSYLEQILSIPGELVAGKGTTEQFIATVLCLDLVAPIMLDIVLDDGTLLQVEGLYGLDEEKSSNSMNCKSTGFRQTRHG
jgi:hypothetical protein